MLTGSYFNVIDGKGRAFVPTKLRYGLSERVWLVKGIDPCLCIFTDEAWRNYTGAYITGFSLEDPNARKLKRFFLSNSLEIDIDGRGRITIPLDHLEYAGIEKDIVFVGMGDMVELWGKKRFEKATDANVIDPSELLRAAARERKSVESERAEIKGNGE
jgi:MraZ protein